MPNPYHDPYSGEFCSRQDLTRKMNASLSEGNFEKYSTFRNILEEAEKTKSQTIQEAFQAVKDNDLKKLKSLIQKDFKNQDIDSIEYRSLIDGLGMNASGEALAILQGGNNPYASSQNLANTFKELPLEGKKDFLLKFSEEKAFSAAVLTKLINPNGRLSSEGDDAHELALTLLDRPHWNSDTLRAVGSVMPPYVVVRKLQEDYESKTRKKWPFKANQTSDEMKLLKEVHNRRTSKNGLFFATNSNNPEVLATLGSVDSNTVEAIIANPNSKLQTLTTIIRNSDTLEPKQFAELKQAILNHPQAGEVLPASTVKLLSKATHNLTNELPKEKEQLLHKGLREQKNLMKYYQSLKRNPDGRTSANAERQYVAAEKEFTKIRAQLDASDVYFASLKKKLATVSRPEHKKVEARLREAIKYRDTQGSALAVKKELERHSYQVDKTFLSKFSF